jgi:hypothetical protein
MLTTLDYLFQHPTSAAIIAAIVGAIAQAIAQYAVTRWVADPRQEKQPPEYIMRESCSRDMLYKSA